MSSLFPIRGTLFVLALTVALSARPTGGLLQHGRRGVGPADRRELSASTVPLGIGLRQLIQLPPEQREQRLLADPGYQSLSPQKRQQMLSALQQFDAMTPEQQQRVSIRLQHLGELNPQQRAGLERIFRQFQKMSPPQRQLFRSAYNDLRALPPEQREQRLSRPAFQQQFTGGQIKSLRQALDLDLPADVVGGHPDPNLPPGF